ncbi:putative uncharacterized protein [Pseudarthrobacter siccitolerans]|uniref:DUF4435 domain-containing protein n=1 Tax=Pseudarthrobacter siccitolerans TaxID=861266 RepID=A0A024H5K5_9MICC|nr:hypothetical protein [Pseudarthrobacter siccitolerans]CCQ47187.1 putative uncharacterized protein [Pseudarthrobacter siccitolerans]
MLEDLDGNDLFNSLMLERGQRTSRVVVVEGESDYNLLADFLQNEALEVIVGYGKTSLLEASQFSLDLLPDVVFLIDADFDRLTGAASSYLDNIVATDFYDLYMDAYFSEPDALVRVARRFLKRSHKVSPEEGINSAIVAAARVGLIRYVSRLHSFNLYLENFPMHLIMGDALGHVDLVRVVRLALKRTKSTSGEETEVYAIADELQRSVESNYLVNSHDLLAAFHAVCSKFGDAAVSHKMDGLFELAVDRAVFNDMPVIQRIHQRLG